MSKAVVVCIGIHKQQVNGMYISNHGIIIILCEMTVFFVLPEATLFTPVILVKVRDDTLFF